MSHQLIKPHVYLWTKITLQENLVSCDSLKMYVKELSFNNIQYRFLWNTCFVGKTVNIDHGDIYWEGLSDRHITSSFISHLGRPWIVRCWPLRTGTVMVYLHCTGTGLRPGMGSMSSYVVCRNVHWSVHCPRTRCSLLCQSRSLYCLWCRSRAVWLNH